MKLRIFILLFSLGFLSCEDDSCNCDYVEYESNPLNNYEWQETFRSSWDASCEDEFLNESVYTDSDGEKWYSETYVECD